MTLPSQDLPHVLLLTNEAPHTAGAGAIVLHRLFGEYPTNRLLVVTNRIPPPDAGRLGCRYERLVLAADRLNRTRAWLWRPALRALGASRLATTGRVDACLRGFRPDVVATLMQDSWYYDLAARYARDCNVPLVLFVHDLPDGFEPVVSWLRGLQRRRDARVYRQAAVRLCISEPMRDHFTAEFSVPGDVLLPPRADTPIRGDPANCVSLKEPGSLILGYAGGLHYGYGEQLLAMLPTLRQTGCRLEYFGPQPAGNVAPLAEATDVIHLNGYAPTPADAWRTLRDRCDALVQPYLNPAGPHERQYRTHFPSKLGDALSLGLPLLLTGPEYASGVVWCSKNGDCGLWAPSGPALAHSLRRLREDPDLRTSLAAKGQAAAEAFSAPLLRSQFHARLTTMARG